MKMNFLIHLKNNKVNSILESVVSDVAINYNTIEKNIVNNIHNYSYDKLLNIIKDIIDDENIEKESKKNIFDRIAIFLWKEYKDASNEIEKIIENIPDEYINVYNNICNYVEKELKRGTHDDNLIEDVIYKYKDDMKKIINDVDINILATLIERIIYSEKTNALLHDIKNIVIPVLI